MQLEGKIKLLEEGGYSRLSSIYLRFFLNEGDKLFKYMFFKLGVI